MKVYFKYLCLSLLLAIYTVNLGIGQNSYAFTWQDYIEFCGNINNSLVTNNDTKWQANRIYTNAELYETLINNLNEDLSNYNTFICIKEQSSSGYNKLIITAKTLTINYNYKISGTTYATYITNANPSIVINLNNNTVQKNTTNIWYGQNPQVRTSRRTNKLWR